MSLNLRLTRAYLIACRLGLIPWLRSAPMDTQVDLARSEANWRGMRAADAAEKRYWHRVETILTKSLI